ncbi:ubiquinone anaerobic biosynthesis accessory factor UbiT [Vibrio sp. RC27]
MINKIHSGIVKNAATLLKSPVQLLPKFVHRLTMLEALRMVFKEALEDGDFEFLDSKWLRVEVTDLDLHWYIGFNDEQLVVSEQEQIADVCFSGTLNDLVLIAGRKEDPDTLFFQRRLSIEGDTELGLEVKNLMDSIDLDALPKTLTIMLNQLAEFVHKGLQSPQSHNEVTNAYSN